MNHYQPRKRTQKIIGEMKSLMFCGERWFGNQLRSKNYHMSNGNFFLEIDTMLPKRHWI
jgi:hypothetical protein